MFKWLSLSEKAIRLQEELTAVNLKKEQLIHSANRVKELEVLLTLLFFQNQCYTMRDIAAVVICDVL